jgi:esterase/lipase superfamily enzyme
MSLITTRHLTVALDRPRLHLPGIYGGALCAIQAPPSLGRFNVYSNQALLGMSDACGKFTVNGAVDFVPIHYIEIEFFEDQFCNTIALAKYADQAYGNIIDPAIQRRSLDVPLQTIITVFQRVLVIWDTPPGYVYTRAVC